MRAIGKLVCRPTDVVTPWHLHGFEPNPETTVGGFGFPIVSTEFSAHFYAFYAVIYHEQIDLGRECKL